ncbi:hypothetical protein DITRI_Ditri01bG0137200 [Diplodiscus trichospermus]
MACGFSVSALSNSVGTLLVDWVAKPVKRQLDYLRHFHGNVEKFKEQKEKLAYERARLQYEIEEADRQLLEIKDDVRGLLSKAVEILTTAESMEREIEKNKRCFGWCPNWWWRYRLSKKLAKKERDISEHLKKMANFGQTGRVGYRPPSTTTIEFVSPKDFMVSKASKKAFSQIVEALSDENVSLIGLWGMGGSGKTTLTREIGNQAKKLNLFDKVVITTVSGKPNFHSIQDEIAKFIDFEMNSGQSRRSQQELWLRLQKEKRILIIVDDVWEKINLKEKIGIPLGEDHKGCQVLLTTRRLHVCRSMQCQRIVRLDCLDDEEARALFEMKAGLENSNDAIKEEAAKIVQKCKGLPIAIVTLGSALKGNTNLDMWKATYRRLRTRRLADIEDINEENAYVCLEESFDYLKDMKTKMCFLLCSLFPEDYEIYMENLVRHAWGLELYEGISSIEEVRSEVLAAIDVLKNSCLLVDSGERHVKMHDMVRDVALWIASNKKEISFSIKSEDIETSSENESFEPYTAISLKKSQIDDLRKALICPNLKILLLLEDYHGELVTDACFSQDMLTTSEAFHFQTNLKTLRLEKCRLVDISILGKLTNLRTLHLERCCLPIITILGKLKKLEVLSFSCSRINQLPEEIGELNNLKLLDLSYCESLERIPRNLIRRLSKLEELYLYGCRLIRWSIEEERYANISELHALSKLKALSLEVAPTNIPKDYVFPRLQRYDVCIGKDKKMTSFSSRKEFENMPIGRSLKIEASMIDACKQLFVDVEFLNLKNLVGHQNLVPSLELELKRLGFNKLTCLALENSNDMKCFIDTTKQHALTTEFSLAKEKKATAFSNLLNLSLTDLHGFEELCNGNQPQGFLPKLKTLRIVNCEKTKGGIPILRTLEMLEVRYCDKTEVLFQTTELGSTQALSHHFVSLKSLKVVKIESCNKLRYLFPATVANSLGQLETLRIDNCWKLKEIILGAGVSIINLHGLREVYVLNCGNLTSLSSLSHGHILENLTMLEVQNCCRLEYTFPISMAKGLPQLKTISLANLSKLKGNDIVFMLPSLQQLTVEICPQLTPFIISAKIQTLMFSKMGKIKQSDDMMVPKLRERSINMEYIIITNFEDYLFDAGSFNLSSLKILTLWNLPELRGIWKGSIQVVNFQNLTQLNVSHCGRLLFIFTATIAQNLPQLSSLIIETSDRLEQIIEKDDETLSQDDHQPIYFPNLVYIEISSCANLKSLFPFCGSHQLQKLRFLFVQDMSKLEKIFEKEDEANVTKDKDEVIHLPQLESLSLKELPYLKHFSPMVYHFVLPSLNSLYVRGCPNIITRFWLDSKQYGHAMTEIIPPIDEHIAEESATTQETTWPIGSDITYWKIF